MSVELLEREVTEIKSVLDIVVDSAEAMDYASEEVIRLKNIRKNMVAYWEEPKKLAYDAWKGVVAKEKNMLDQVDITITGLTRKINVYLTEEKRKAEEERKKQERLVAEQQAKQKAEAEAAIKALKEQQAELTEQGNIEEAEAVNMEIELEALNAETVSIPAPETVFQKSFKTDVGTVSSKEDIAIEIIDKKALIEAMVSADLLELLEIKEAKLKQWLKLTGKESFPGIKIDKVVNALFRGK